MVDYLPIPPRVWSRVQNPCVYNLLPSNSSTTYVPLTNQHIPLAQANYEEKLLYKGNILQHRTNSAQLTRKQKYSQIANGLGPNRKKVYATQSQTYTNPNTTGFLRVNYDTYPYPNQIVGAPNNISGPYQYNVPNPSDCSGNSIQDGGSLVCGTYANPCTGQIVKSGASSATICAPSYCSDVPGSPIELCWNKKVQPWLPKQRYTMNNSGDKWPQGYKEFVSAVHPKPPVLALVVEDDGTIEISWAPRATNCLPIYSFNVYINETLYTTIKNTSNILYYHTINKDYIRSLLQNALTDNYEFTIHITATSRVQEPLQSSNYNPNYGSTKMANYSLTANSGLSKSFKLPSFSNNNSRINSDFRTNNTRTFNYGMTPHFSTYESRHSNYLYFSSNLTFSSGGFDCSLYNKLFKNNTIVQINTYLANYINSININTQTRIDLDTYNNIQTALGKLKLHMDPTCCFFNILDIYSNIWKALWAAYNQKMDFFDLSANSARWREDSIILHDNNLLQEFLKQLQSASTLKELDLTVTAEKAGIKPRYARYFELYGIPENLDFDPDKMLQIDIELSSSSSGTCSEECSAEPSTAEPSTANTSAVPSTANTSAVPSTANTSTVPSTANTSAVPSTANTSAVPSTANTSAVPSTANTSAAPSTANTSAAPSTANTSAAPSSDEESSDSSYSSSDSDSD